MRIAMLSWESLHSIAVGGVAAHVTELAAALARRGHQIHVFKYTNLRRLILENETSLMESLTAVKDHAFETATDVKDAGVEKARGIARDVDEGVHQNPWPYIGGSVVVSVLLGYILGRSRK